MYIQHSCSEIELEVRMWSLMVMKDISLKEPKKIILIIQESSLCAKEKV